MPNSRPKTAFARQLNRIIRQSVATPQELARQVDCHPEHINAVARGDSSMSLHKAEVISSYLADECDEMRQVSGFLGTRGETHFRPTDVENDDDIRVEICDARNDGTRAIEAMDEGKREEAARHVRKGIEDYMAALQDIQQPAQ